MAANSLTFEPSALAEASFERLLTRLNDLAAQIRSRRADSKSLSAATLKQSVRELIEIERIATAELVVSSKRGDDDAKALLIERYQARVAGFVFGVVGNRHAIDDLCQTIFCKMLVALPRLKDNNSFESWLFRIARNACFDHLRHQRLRRIFVPWHAAAEQVPASEHCRDEHRIDAFRHALMTLPSNQRELVALLQDDQMTYEQLAAITNSSISAVKSRLFRARRTLRKVMHEDD